MRRDVRKPRCLTVPSYKWTEAERRSVVAYVKEIEDYVYGLENSVLLFIFQRETGLDPSAPPHDVPCPRCLAFALEPCRNEARLPPTDDRPNRPGPWSDTSLLTLPHEERKAHAVAHPEYRARALP